MRNLGVYFGFVEPTDAERAAIEAAGPMARLRETAAITTVALLLGACLAALTDASITRALILGLGLALALGLVARLRR